MKKILIHTDGKLFGEVQRDLNLFIPSLEKMKKTYEALEMGSFTNEVMTDLKKHGENSIETKFYQNITSQLDRAGIKLKLVRQNMINGSQTTLNEFKNALEEARNVEAPQYVTNQRPVLHFQQISYNDDNKVFEIDEETKENILETLCRVYLTNETEKNIYDSLQNFVKAQQEVRSTLINAGYVFQRKGYEIDEIKNTFLSLFPSVSVIPGAVKYAAGQRAQKERVAKMLGKSINEI